MPRPFALLIIDMQNCFLDEIGEPELADSAIAVINHSAGFLRSAGMPVLHVKDVEEAEYRSADELDFAPGIERLSSEAVVEKRMPNAFWETDLEQRLRELDVEFVVLAGQAVEHCVLFTYNGARERGFVPVMLQDGVMGEARNSVAAALRLRNFISWPAIRAMASS